MKEIVLTRGLVAQVDDEDYNYLASRKWHALSGKRTWYAGSGKKGFRMHRMLLYCPQGFVIDHVDGNGLNNQKGNLRVVTNAQNKHNAKPYRTNTTGAKGIDRKGKRWAATLSYENKQYHIGVFDEFRQAVKAYNQKGQQLIGDCFRPNSI